MTNWVRLASGFLNTDQIAKFNIKGDSGEAILSSGLKVVLKGTEFAAVVAAIERQLSPPPASE